MAARTRRREVVMCEETLRSKVPVGCRNERNEELSRALRSVHGPVLKNFECECD